MGTRKDDTVLGDNFFGSIKSIPSSSDQNLNHLTFIFNGAVKKLHAIENKLRIDLQVLLKHASMKKYISNLITRRESSQNLSASWHSPKMCSRGKDVDFNLSLVEFKLAKKLINILPPLLLHHL